MSIACEICLISLHVCIFSQDNDPLMSQSPWRNKLSCSEGETLGGFPVKFLVQVVSLFFVKEICNILFLNVELDTHSKWLLFVCFCFQTRLSKILMIKKEHIKHLKEMNTEAERLVCYSQNDWKRFQFSNRFKERLNNIPASCIQKSYSMPIDLDFQKRYAITVLELDQLNKDLNKVFHEVQQFCCDVS